MYTLCYKDKDGFVRLLMKNGQASVFQHKSNAEVSKESLIDEIKQELRGVECKKYMFGLIKKEERTNNISIYNRIELERIISTVFVMNGNIAHLMMNPVNINELLE